MNIHTFFEDLKKIIFNRNFLIMMLISACNSFATSMGKTPLTIFGMSLGMTGAAVRALSGTYYLVCKINIG
jgi:hypothetical protein